MPNIAPEPRAVHVAAGVVRDGAGRVLVARRPAHAHLGGLWEFPGGKVEPGEPVLAALARELAEELAIDVHAARPLLRVAHDYPDRRVLLDVWEVARWRGRPWGREGQELRWVTVAELSGLDLPSADTSILTALSLPDVYLVTPEPHAGLLPDLEACLAAGVRLVQWRARRAGPGAQAALIERALALCERYGARLLLNGAPQEARALGAHGVHLTAARTRALAGQPRPQGLLLAASCHDAAELALARALGVDLAVLGPVLPTASHPGARTLGWERFAALVPEAGCPVYALGGLAPEHLPAAWRAGARGIAAIGAFWEVPSPAAAVERCLAAREEALLPVPGCGRQ